jgi:nicotinamide phosphoribosyltransferase
MNTILSTDSYKLTHWNQYPKGTTGVYSYFESREGATYPYTVFFGLQKILEKLATPIRYADIEEASELAAIHFGNDELFNRKGWEYIYQAHVGMLPLRIKAVPEGSVIPTGNALMTVENTDPKCYWLTNFVESLLTHVWYPSTVATVSRAVKETIAQFLTNTADSQDSLPFMLHDFGYRGASSDETAAIGGAAHLVNFMGTDTLPAMLLAHETYDADYESLAFSVPATEHSVMTALGSEGEYSIVHQLLQDHPTGILSVVADSYNIYRFVEEISNDTWLRTEILERDGVFVVRPDSTTPQHPTPETLTEWIVTSLGEAFGTTTNSKGFKVLDPHVRVLWGDGIDPHGIANILGRLQLAGYSAENMVFGMGGGLLQKVNRDTQRFAFKCSAQERDGIWHDVSKNPLDSSKKSKAGRLQLSRFVGEHGEVSYRTLEEGLKVGITADYRGPHDQRDVKQDILETVFENGKITRHQTFADIRERAAL